MIDWTASMQQTFEYYIVDPATWRDRKQIQNVVSCSINRDSEAETLGSATIDIDESIGEHYIRSYLIAIQNGENGADTEKIPLGTHLVQTPSSSFTGKAQDVTIDTYSPLLELKENPPPLGYYIPKGSNIMDMAYRLIREQARAPVVKVNCAITLSYDFVADTQDSWLSFISDLIANAKYKLALDEMGRILFAPDQDTASLQPVWTYDDGNSSILYPEISMDHDLFDIPNVLEVIYSNGSSFHYVKAVNDDPNSPTSTVSRGREILHRDTNPSLVGNLSEGEVRLYAEQQLRNLSTLEYTITYTHGYCPVRVGDCVRLNYVRAGIKDVKAKVISQTIKCEPGCPVTEKAVFTQKLWG